MADSTTTHRGYTKPEDGASEDTWGVKLNNDLDAIDDDVFKLLTTAGYAINAGSANALSVTLDPEPEAYFSGMRVDLLVLAANTSAVTLDVNGLGAKTVLANDGTALTAGALAAGGVYRFTHDGTQFKLLGTALASAAETLTGTESGKAISPASFAGNKSLGASGYYKLPGGFTIQWGKASISVGEGATSVSFPVAFTNACYNLVTTMGNPTTNVNLDSEIQVVSLSTTGASLFVQRFDASVQTTTEFYWQALGL